MFRSHSEITPLDTPIAAATSRPDIRAAPRVARNTSPSDPALILISSMYRSVPLGIAGKHDTPP
ncbi:hypothetical protein LTDYDHKI_CDS0023 [Exiguobacterium phage phiExGM16]